MERFLEDLFLKVLNMSVTAGYIIIGFVILRFLLKKPLEYVPKKYLYSLWSVAAFRLICPVSFTLPISFFGFASPAAEGSSGHEIIYIPPDIRYHAQPTVDLGIDSISQAVSGSLPPANPAGSMNPIQFWIFVGMVLWMLGMAVMIGYGAVSYFRFAGKIRKTVKNDDGFFRCSGAISPFILGIFKPKIFVPEGIEGPELEYVLAHEKCHIKRRDNLIKLFAFAVLALHWFNPLVWLAYYLMCRDMEMSCDEAVLKKGGINREYSLLLLSLAERGSFPALSPLAFGETSVRSRIKNALIFKKRGVWISVIAAAICAVLIIGCAANPRIGSGKLSGIENTETIEIKLEESGEVFRIKGIPVEDICENLLSLRLKKMEYSEPTIGLYSLTFLNPDGEEIDRITISVDQWISIDGYFHYVSEGELDLSTIEEQVFWYKNSGPKEEIEPTEEPKPTAEPDEKVDDIPEESQPSRMGLDGAVSLAILSENASSFKNDDVFPCEAHYIFETADNGDGTVTAYIGYMYGEFFVTQRKNISLSAVINETAAEFMTGISSYAALTFEVGEGDEYILTEYWQPRDGSYWWGDITEKFPEHLHGELSDSERSQKLVYFYHQKCYGDAIEHFGIDTKPFIEAVFAELIKTGDTPQLESDRSLPIRELNYYGAYTLRYIYSRFLEGSVEEPLGKLMQEVMTGLNGEIVLRLHTETGQEYFDSWLEAAEKDREELGEIAFAEKYPLTNLAIEMKYE